MSNLLVFLCVVSTYFYSCIGWCTLNACRQGMWKGGEMPSWHHIQLQSPRERKFSGLLFEVDGVLNTAFIQPISLLICWAVCLFFFKPNYFIQNAKIPGVCWESEPYELLCFRYYLIVPLLILGTCFILGGLRIHGRIIKWGSKSSTQRAPTLNQRPSSLCLCPEMRFEPMI